ncbi:MAG TPA: hypothetical protein VHL80_04435 [Polyangia bacterium]|nr:hypothetical protein [Polyangia bacterium]
MRAAAVVLRVVSLAVFTFAAVAALGARPARAFEDFEGTRALGMGGATRAWALGDSALLLNPSGMSIAKIYNLEAAYGYGSRASENLFHASIVDSTSASTLAGGVYYTYRLDEPAQISGHSHEVGAALSLPFSQFLALGATLKWFRFEGADDAPTAPAGTPATTSSGLTFDVGTTVRPTENLSFAVVGANLVDRHHGQAPRAIGYGAAFLPLHDLVIALDGLTTLTRDDLTGARGTGVRAGVEVALAQRVALRAGGGTDPAAGAGYLSLGASLLSEMGAIDVGARGDLFPYGTGSARNVFLGISLRLFVPAAVASAAAGSGQSP